MLSHRNHTRETPKILSASPFIVCTLGLVSSALVCPRPLTQSSPATSTSSDHEYLAACQIPACIWGAIAMQQSRSLPTRLPVTYILASVVLLEHCFPCIRIVNMWFWTFTVFIQPFWEIWNDFSSSFIFKHVIAQKAKHFAFIIWSTSNSIISFP